MEFDGLIGLLLFMLQRTVGIFSKKTQMKRNGKETSEGPKMDSGNGLALLQFQQNPLLGSGMNLIFTKGICLLGLGLAG